jgi:hypothetical protein
LGKIKNTHFRIVLTFVNSGSSSNRPRIKVAMVAVSPTKRFTQMRTTYPVLGTLKRKDARYMIYEEQRTYVLAKVFETGQRKVD